MGADFSNLNGLLDILQDLVGDAIVDTLQVIPFLFLTYLLLEFMEHKMSAKALEKFEKAGALGPIAGSLLGAFPQCGFSSAASTLYAGRVITIGTLFAVYLSTSDEMIPIFLAGGIPIQEMLGLILAKILIGLIMGFAIDGFMNIVQRDKKKGKKNYEIHDLCERDHCSCDNHEKSNSKILRPAIFHTLQVTLFVFFILIVLNVIILVCGGFDTMANFVSTNKYLSVLATSIIGLIPNCAASVAISQLFVEGIIGPGAVLAGLLSASGVGLVVLFRNNRPMKQNVYIVIALFAISIVIGLVVSLLVG